MSSPLNEHLEKDVKDIFRRVVEDLNIVDKYGLNHYESSVNTTKIDEVTFVQLFENLGEVCQVVSEPLLDFFIYQAARDGFIICLFGCMDYRQYHFDLIMRKVENKTTKKPEQPERQNSLLRSACAIAQRKGKDTNWEAFEKSLRAELLMQDDTVAWSTDEEKIFLATRTPPTYQADL